MYIRKSPIAGSWYPPTAATLGDAVDRHLAAASDRHDAAVAGPLVALAAPHAGLMYSGPVAAHAYALLRDQHFDVAILVGPAHFVGFDGVALVPDGSFETPLGFAMIDDRCAADLRQASHVIRADPHPHGREHSLEMQLPFLQRVAPETKIVPLLMGFQTEKTASVLGDALASVLAGRRALLVASTDLSHYHDAATAYRLDAVVLDCVRRFDPDALQDALDANPEHACGGGPLVAVMRAAKLAGARDGAVLAYADSGDVSGDKSAVVGYMAAAFGNFETGARDEIRS
jgi:AmmeMemoRadiSam system protein B